MASGFSPVDLTSPRVASVLRSKMVIIELRPLLMKPRPRSAAMAMPCTPERLAISPTFLPLSTSTTSTLVACET